ncbi:MAG: S8/S53 family peptidase [Actinomycetota bacterium]
MGRLGGKCLIAGLVTIAVTGHAAVGLMPATAAPDKRVDPNAVVALIDSGINPYSVAFRDASPLARKHPSKYIPGYPKDAQPLKLSLDLPYERALEKDEKVWQSVEGDKLYYIPGTRIVGAISFGAGGTYCPSTTAIPPVGGVLGGDCQEHRILDDYGHGTMTASRAAGSPNSLAPGARIVMIEGLGAQGVEWAADAGWIDVQSNSWLSLIPPPLDGAVGDTSAAFEAAAGEMLTIAASGNGTAYLAGVAPTPTYLLSTASPGVVLVGGHDNGKATLWAGAPPHVVADAYSGMTAIVHSSEKMRPDPMACCTSAAAPYAAGGALAIILEARRILGDPGPGVDKGVYASGPKDLVREGPLADGKFTLEELKDVFFHTAETHPAEGRDDGDIHWGGEPRAPELDPYGPGDNPFCVGCTTTPLAWKSIPDAVDTYQLIGYGGINENSTALAAKVLAGDEPLPERPTADAQYQLDQQLREIFFATNP